MPRTMWAVGTDDGEGWGAVDAANAEEARLAWARQNDALHSDGTVGNYILAQRVEAWDNIPRNPNGADWLNAGLSYTCSRLCGGMAFLDDGGAVIDGEPVCAYCVEDRAY